MTPPTDEARATAFEDVPLTAEELALARRWAQSQIGRPSTRTDTQPLSQRKATVLIYRLLATIGALEEAEPGPGPGCIHVGPIESLAPAEPDQHRCRQCYGFVWPATPSSKKSDPL